MSSDLTPAQRLAISRARLTQALQDPAWLILVQRWLQARSKAHPPAPADHSAKG
jgi:hypothetical protein